MIDQLFMKDLAYDLAPPLETEQPATLLASGPATSDVGQVSVQGYDPSRDTAGGGFVGYRLNTPKAGQPQPTQQDREKLAIGLLDSLAGALRGAVAQIGGLPGDIRSIVDMISQEGAEKYLGQRSFATTEELLKDTSMRIPGTQVDIPFPPVLGAGATNIAERQPVVNAAQEVGTFLPAPGIPEAVVQGAKLVGKAIKATKGLPVGMSIQDVGKMADDLIYQGEHKPPMRDGGASLDDVTGGGAIYPEDIYSPNGARYYGDGSPMDNASFSIVNQFKGKPDASVTIYRAIPATTNNAQKLTKLESDMAAYMRRNKLPKDAFTDNGNVWYDWASKERDRLQNTPDETVDIKPSIQKGDWVTINRQYAKEHGEGALNGDYKIISKKVKASEIFTNGDSIHEWGYDPIKKSEDKK